MTGLLLFNERIGENLMEGLKKSFLVRGNSIVGLSDKNFSTLHVGCVIPFAGNADNIPRGYLLCDGASYKVVDYPHLYAVIGNTYGGDSTNFNVPNLVDKFIQGSTTSGTEKEAGLPNIEGQIGNESDSHAIFYNSTISGAFEANKKAKLAGGGSSSGEWYAKALFDASRSNPIYGNSDTVQPPALTMVYIIKAYHTNEGVDSGVSDDVVEYVEGEIATKLDKGYITGVTDANNAIGENGVNIFVMSASSANMPLPRTGVIRSYTTIENKYIRINQEYSTIDNSPQNGGTYKRYGASDDGGATFTWSNWSSVGSIDVDISKVFSNGALNISTLCGTYGNGRYVIVGQGTAGNGSATIDIWTLASRAISYIVNVTYSNKTSNTFIGLTYENPTINFEAGYLSACNHIAKVCTLA